MMSIYQEFGIRFRLRQKLGPTSSGGSTAKLHVNGGRDVSGFVSLFILHMIAKGPTI